MDTQFVSHGSPFHPKCAPNRDEENLGKANSRELGHPTALLEPDLQLSVLFDLPTLSLFLRLADLFDYDSGGT